MITTIKQADFDKAVSNHKRILTERTQQVIDIQTTSAKELALYVTQNDTVRLIEFYNNNYDALGHVNFKDPEELAGLISRFIGTYLNQEFKW